MIITISHLKFKKSIFTIDYWLTDCTTRTLCLKNRFLEKNILNKNKLFTKLLLEIDKRNFFFK